jgi:hypothetical protein
MVLSTGQSRQVSDLDDETRRALAPCRAREPWPASDPAPNTFGWIVDSYLYRSPAHQLKLVVVLIALLALGGGYAPAAFAQCGQTITVNPTASPVAGPPPLVIGDSVLYDAAKVLAADGFAVNAMVCRQMSQGIALLEAKAGTLPHLVVVELGTNGPVTRADIEQVLAILGPSRILALVTPHNGVAPEADTVIRAAEGEYRGHVGVLDWDRYSAAHPGWFASDGVHLGGSAGINAFAQLIETTLSYADASSTPAARSTQSTTPSTTSTTTSTTQHLPPSTTTVISPSTTTKQQQQPSPKPSLGRLTVSPTGLSDSIRRVEISVSAELLAVLSARVHALW